MLQLIGFDADDTLWENEHLYQLAEEKFLGLLSPYQDADFISRALYDMEMRNITIYGYGIKSFALSMIETALLVSNNTVTAPEIQHILAFIREMLEAEVQIIDCVEDVLATLKHSYDLMLITKGDALEQSRKIDRSGLRPYFKYVEIVHDKNPAAYGELLEKLRITPVQFVMVGNSLRSDIHPVVAIGGQAIYIPHHLTWAHENDIPGDLKGFHYHQVDEIQEVPNILRKIDLDLKD